MLVGLLAVTVGPVPAAAASESPLGTPNVNQGGLAFSIGGTQEVYFPWVYNGDDFGLGAASGSVTVQNLSNVDGYVYFFVGNGDGYDYTTYAFLSAGASKTFTASQISVPEGGAPVVAALYYDYTTVASTVTVCEGDILQDLNNDDDLLDCVPVTVTSNAWWPAPLGGLVKSAVAGASLPYTTAADTSVSGYNGLSGSEVGYFDQQFLPIVQTNCGPGGCWNTRITVSNFRRDANAAVTIRFFPADDGSGSLNTGFQVNALLNPGASYQLTLSDWVPEGWVGSASIQADDAVGAIADRFKVGTNMWLTNIGSNQTSEFAFQESNVNTAGFPYVLFAPSVYLDFNGWNTGINVANLYEGDNNVNIQYYVNGGNAIQTQTQRLAAYGMTYFYNPSSPSEDDSNQEVQYDRVSGALILSDEPVAAAVDAVKYFGNDQNVGQAMTYNATGNIYTWQSMPLVQKGSPTTGMGATSGLNFINPTAANNAVTINWLNQSGFQADNFGTSTLIIPPASLGFAYTMNQENIPNGYYGSAIAQSQFPVAMASANVDYQVQGDGSTMFLGYNPCGLFRQADGCYVGNGLGGLVGGTFVKSVATDTGVAVPGATVTIYSGISDYTTVTDMMGNATFAGVNPGSYLVDVTLPTGYSFSDTGDPTDVTFVGEGPVQIVQGQTTTLTNTVYVATAQKIVQVVGPTGSNLSIAGLTVCIYPSGATIPDDITTDTTDSVACGITDANGVATFNGLTAGVEYVPVVAGNGFDQVVGDPFTLVAGTSETNYVALGEVPGALTKAIDLGDFDFGVAFGDFALNADVIFCKASDVPVDANGVIDTTACDNWVEDPAAVAHGGYDTNLGGSDFIYEFNADVAPGDYVICSSAFVTGDFDADPATPDETVGYDFMCENTYTNDAGVTGPITVTSGEETYVLNDFGALAAGSLDVYVTQAGTVAPAGVTVNLYENGDNDGDGVSNEQIGTTTTDATGIASFAVPSGSYTVTAIGTPGFETQDATIDYDVATDIADGLVDVAPTGDVSIDQSATP